MYTRIISNGFSNVQLEVNSVIDSSSQVVLFKHNRVLLSLTFTGSKPNSVSITNGTDIQYINIPYIETLTVDITHFITFPFTYNTYQTYQLFTVKVYYNNENPITFNVPIVEALYGKSYPFRAPVTLYKQMPNDSDIIELYSPFDGVIQSGTDVQQIRQGLNIVDLTDIGDRFYISNSVLSTFDDTFDYTFQQDHTAYLCEIDRVCAINQDALLINYTNANGENSYLLGYRSEIENSFDGDNYQSNEITIYNKQTKLHLTDHSQEMTVVIPNVIFTAYPSDIMLNETVNLTFQNKVYKASPIADATTYSDAYQDYELKFKIL